MRYTQGDTHKKYQRFYINDDISDCCHFERLRVIHKQDQEQDPLNIYDQDEDIKFIMNHFNACDTSVCPRFRRVYDRTDEDFNTQR